jgi:hypothetical protein
MLHTIRKTNSTLFSTFTFSYMQKRSGGIVATSFYLFHFSGCRAENRTRAALQQHGVLPLGYAATLNLHT